ncbi:Methylmalonyl-CoA decarboxylase [compost metagenome]
MREIAGMIADNAPLSVRAAKLMTNEAMKEPAKRDLEFCKALVRECFASKDYTEGRTAFMEKRRPRFTGH